MNLTFSEFKKIVYSIENQSNRYWKVDSIFPVSYPNSFLCANLESCQDKDEKYTIVKNSYLPIFGIAKVKGFGASEFFDNGFVNHSELENYLKESLNNKKVEFNVLPKELLELKFFGKDDFEYKLKSLNISADQIQLTINHIKLEESKYTLFFGGNLGFELFNDQND